MRYIKVLGFGECRQDTFLDSKVKENLRGGGAYDEALRVLGCSSPISNDIKYLFLGLLLLEGIGAEVTGNSFFLNEISIYDLTASRR